MSSATPRAPTQDEPIQDQQSGRVWLTDDSGGVYDIDSGQAAQAFRDGYRPADQAQIDKALEREQFGTSAQAVRTALERAAGTASFGLSDYAASQFDPRLADEMRKRAEINPTAGTVGKIGGFFAPGAAVKLLKGVRGVGTLAELAQAPLSGMTKAGEFAEGLAGSLVGTEAESLLGRVAQKAITSGARMGTEGAMLGAGDAISEESLGPDHELTAEKILAGAKDGFGTGVLFGGGLGAVEALGHAGAHAVMDRLEKIISPKDVEELAEKHFGEAAPGLGEAWAKASAAASGKDIDAIRTLGPQNWSREAQEARRVAVYEGDAIRDEAKRAVREHIDEINQATRNLTEEYMGGLKAEHVASSIRKGEEALGQQVEFAQGQVGAIRSKVEEMLADPTAYGQVADLKKMTRFLDLADRGIEAAAEDGNGAKAYVELDNLKKRLGRLAKPGSFISTSSDMAVSQEVRGLYENLRQGLEDEGMWGKAGLDQQKINKAWSKYIDTKSLFEQRLSTQLGRDPNNPWVRQLTADPAKIDAYIEGLTSPKNDLVHQTIKDHLANSDALAEALTGLNDIGPEQLAEFGKVVRSSEGFKKTIAEAEKSLVLTNQLKALESGSNGGMLGGLGGLLVGGLPGGVLGAVGGALANPGRAVRQLAALEKIVGGVDGKIHDAISSFSKRAVKVAGEAGEHLGREKFAEAILKGEIDERSGYHDVTHAIHAAAARPEHVQERLEKMVGGGLTQTAPAVMAAAMKRNVDNLAFLQGRIPGGVAPAGAFPSARSPEPPDSQQQSFLRLAKGTLAPMSTVKAFEKGELSPEAVDGLRRSAPGVLGQLTSGLIAEAGNLAAKGKELPYDSKLELWQLTGIATDATLEPAFIAQIQAMHASTRGGTPPPAGSQFPAPAAPKRKVDTSESHMSATEKLEAPL